MKLEIDKKVAGIIATAAVMGIIALGFYGFYTFIVPQLVGLSALSFTAVAGFGILAGVLSFFAPCSLAIFPSYMGYYLSESGETGRAEALRYGITASSGMILFYGLLGVTVSYIAGLSSVRSILKIGIPVMALILGAVGIYFLIGRTFKGQLFASLGEKFLRTEGNLDRNLFLFGFGYSMSSIACIFPVFLLLIAYPFITGNIALGITAFFTFSIGKSAVMIIATVLASESRTKILSKHAQKFGYIKKASGALLVLVSVYLAYYTLALYQVINPIEILS